MLDKCHRPPHPLLVKAIEEFNAGRYFESHEFLETLWRDEPGAVRDLYKGILQVAAALHHLRRGKFRGPRRLLGRALELLEPFRPACRGYDMDSLCHDAEALLAQVESVLQAKERDGAEAEATDGDNAPADVRWRIVVQKAERSPV